MTRNFGMFDGTMPVSKPNEEMKDQKESKPNEDEMKNQRESKQGEAENS